MGSNGCTGIGLVCGTVSGNLNCSSYTTAAPTCGAPSSNAATSSACTNFSTGSSPDAEKTPGGGIHLLYRSTAPVDGNQKLARRADPATGEIQVLLETRGEGGYVVVAPTNGTNHPTGRPWELLRGGFTTIATITSEERQALLDVARSFTSSTRVRPPRAPSGM